MVLSGAQFKRYGRHNRSIGSHARKSVTYKLRTSKKPSVPSQVYKGYKAK
jgi:hypothetical protein